MFSNYEEDVILRKKDMILIKNIPKFPQFNDQKFEIIKVIDKLHIEIGTNFKEELESIFCNETTAEIMKETEIFEFLTLEEALTNPQFLKLDFLNVKKEAVLHLILKTFLEFQERFGKLPEKKHLEDLKEIAEELNLINICNEFNNEDIRLDYSSEVDPNLLKLVIEKEYLDFPPLGAFFGAIIAQEVLKFTKKFVPLKTWFFYDIYEIIKCANENTSNFASSPSQDLYEIFFGKRLMDLMQNQK